MKAVRKTVNNNYTKIKRRPIIVKTSKKGCTKC